MSQGAKALKIEVLIRVLGVALTVGTIVAVGVRFRAPVMDPFLPSVAVFFVAIVIGELFRICLLYTSPSPRDRQKSRMPSSA